MKRWITMLLLTALAAWAADVSGKWTGTLEGGPKFKGGAFVVNLKQSRQSVTGTSGGAESQRDFRNGKLQGQQLTFEAVSGSGGDGLGERVTRFNLTLAGNKLEGEAVGQNEHGAPVTMKVSVTRAK